MNNINIFLNPQSKANFEQCAKEVQIVIERFEKWIALGEPNNYEGYKIKKY